MGRKAASNVVPLKGGDLCEPDPKAARRARAVDSYKRRNASNPTLPGITIKMQQVGDTTHANISVDHPDALDGYRIIGDAMASGDGTFVASMVKDITALGWKDIDGRQLPDADRANFALSIIKEIGPRDPLETLLASQMAAIHMATMGTASLHAASKTLERKELTERSLNKLARTFAAQVEALKRYRSKGEQRVIVERVTVESGGQAVVGLVEQGGGGSDVSGR